MNALKGKRIVVTRARHQAHSLQRLLRDQGAIPISFPCLAIEPLRDPSALDAQLGNLGHFEILLLTSSNTVAAVAERLRALDLRPDWKRLRIATLGPATDASLRELLHTGSDFSPAVPSAGCLAQTLPVTSGDRILLPQSALADDSTANILRSRGAKVTAMVAYHTVIGSGGADIAAMITRDEIDALSFTSPSAAAFFRKRCPLPASLALPTACMGPATARKADELGFRLLLQPNSPSLRGMIDALASHFDNSSASQLR